MALQASGPISFSQIQTEFGGANPISLSEYYKNGSYVPSTVGVAAGTYTAFSGTTSYTFVYTSYGFTDIYWAGSLVAGLSGNVSYWTVGGYDYNRGSQWNYIPSSKSQPESRTYYQVQRRTTATTTTVNGNIPTSGVISLSNFYGGRKT